MKRLTASLLALLSALFCAALITYLRERGALAQQQGFGNVVTLTSGAPNPVTQVSAAFVGTPGPGGTFFYWVVANYPIGSAPPLSPAVVTNVPTLGGGNSVSISWITVGATNYDIIRSTTNAVPGARPACRVPAAAGAHRV